MIQINHRQIAHIPCLVVSDGSSEPQPIVTYFHGFTSSKEQNLSQAYYLAKKGFTVILPDSLHHGERQEKELSEYQFDFWKIVLTNVNELKIIYNWVNENEWLKEDQFGIAGTSMGGITTASALTQYDWIKAAGIMMGSAKTYEMAHYLIESLKSQGAKLPFSEEELNAELDQLKPYDLSTQLELLNDRPLFVWHGTEDKVVPFKHSED